MIKKTKSSKPQQIVDANMTPGLIAKNRYYADLDDTTANIMFIDKKEWRERLVYTVDRFFEDPDVIELDEFGIAYKIPKTTLYDWRQKYPEINHAFEHAKVILAVRRRKGAAVGRYKDTVIFKDIHVYDNQWQKNVDEYHVALRNKEAESRSGIQLVALADIRRTAELDEFEQKKLTLQAKDKDVTQDTPPKL